MRILLVTGDQPIEQQLMHLLEGGGHELTRVSAGGDEALSRVEEGARFHAAVLSEGVLGRGWPRQIRDLRRRAPYLPAVVLLAADGEHAWRHAILAGAYEALPLQRSLDAILEALSRALQYSAGKMLQGAPLGKG
jgi:DNA-binding NtrC family response regulator